MNLGCGGSKLILMFIIKERVVVESKFLKTGTNVYGTNSKDCQEETFKCCPKHIAQGIFNRSLILGLN